MSRLEKSYRISTLVLLGILSTEYILVTLGILPLEHFAAFVMLVVSSQVVLAGRN